VPSPEKWDVRADSIPLVSRTRATFRSAEFGFFVSSCTRACRRRAAAGRRPFLAPLADLRPGVAELLLGAGAPADQLAVVGMRWANVAGPRYAAAAAPLHGAEPAHHGYVVRRVQRVRDQLRERRLS